MLRLSNKIEKLKEIVDKSNKIVFLLVRVYQLQVVYLISAQWVDYLMKFQKRVIHLNIYIDRFK